MLSLGPRQSQSDLGRKSLSPPVAVKRSSAGADVFRTGLNFEIFFFTSASITYLRLLLENFTTNQVFVNHRAQTGVSLLRQPCSSMM